MMTIDELYEKTSDSYSFNRYNSWKSCIKKLRSRGHNDFEIQAILRSKWARWAADSSSNPYGKASSLDLIRYIERSESLQSIEKFTEEAFPGYKLELDDVLNMVKNFKP